MKKVRIVIIAVVLVGLVCGGFYYMSSKKDVSVENKTELTTLDKLILKDLESNYPSTPRAVVKLYNQIITCYYSAEFKDDEFEKLVDQALLLFDDELKAKNPKDEYMETLSNEIEEYKTKDKTISQTAVCSSNDVLYRNDNGDEIAYVNASYFIKEGKEHVKTYEQYVLRKDEKGNWKILGYYEIEEDPTESDY
ncbi:MAG: DUF6715 family protein [Agathobacter sp.]|nr:DUF6715 family protein [Agathobacter sp.]